MASQAVRQAARPTQPQEPHQAGGAAPAPAPPAAPAAVQPRAVPASNECRVQRWDFFHLGWLSIKQSRAVLQ